MTLFKMHEIRAIYTVRARLPFRSSEIASSLRRFSRILLHSRMNGRLGGRRKYGRKHAAPIDLHADATVRFFCQQ